MPDTNEKEKKAKRRIWILVLILSLALLLGGAAAYIFTHPWWDRGLDPSQFHTTEPRISEPSGAGELPENPTETQPELSTEPTEPLPDNPIDFAGLRELNDDIYAWLNLPMGPERDDIDLPLLQAALEEDDNYYLHKDLNRQYRYAGSLYTQKANAKDFSDRVTVIYGHNMLDGTMFSNLVLFQNKQFFQDHEFFTIYTPGHILTYRIAAAIQFDTRHLLNCFDFSDDQVFADWIQNYILSPKSMIRNVREGIEVTTEDKLVILSTCLEHGASRYLIQGVLVADERTN